jgi:hypothetical protein
LTLWPCARRPSTSISRADKPFSTTIASGFFQNVGSTRREGGDLNLTYQFQRVSAYVQYSHLKATFRSAFLEPSPANPFQDANGNVQVNVGDESPAMPRAYFGGVKISF